MEKKSLRRFILATCRFLINYRRDCFVLFSAGTPFSFRSREAMISPVRSSAPSYVTYIWRDSLATGSVRLTPEVTIENCRKCTLSEARTIIESGTTGLRTWTASFVLAEYLTKQRSEGAPVSDQGLITQENTF